MHAKKMRNEIEKEMSSRSIATQTRIVIAVLFWASRGPIPFSIKSLEYFGKDILF